MIGPAPRNKIIRILFISHDRLGNHRIKPVDEKRDYYLSGIRVEAVGDAKGLSADFSNGDEPDGTEKAKCLQQQKKESGIIINPL